eukprot:TRINITY_DN8035_c0_g1_i2.p1 TRINITY_DN8035_c0_g1~~TRINITY_DN8035_c0_g1_i2.p1  ORF type:complete len:835 (-),score=213.56 TRINITY_DN8035_c0_g1_i2:232-2736(-)
MSQTTANVLGEVEAESTSPRNDENESRLMSNEGQQQTKLKPYTRTMRKRSLVEKIILLQSVIRGWLHRKRYVKLLQVSPEREKVIREIIETEKKYREWLRVMTVEFIKPVSEVCSRKVVSKAFLNIDRLLQISEELCKALKERLKSSMLENSNNNNLNNDGNNNEQPSSSSPGDEEKKNTTMSSTRIADVFLPFIPRIISEYSYFNHHYQKAREFCSAKMQQPTNAFTIAFKKCQEKSTSITFGSLFIMPIQRIPRYKMLLQRLEKYTEEGHPDKKITKIAIEQISRVADIIDYSINNYNNPTAAGLNNIKNSKNEGESTSAMVANSLFSAFTFALQPIIGLPSSDAFPVPPPSGRYCLHYGPLIKICRKTPKERWFYLFNDVLIYGKKLFGTESVRYVRHLSLLKATVLQHLNTQQRSVKSSSSNQPEMKNAFHIIAKEKSFTVIAKTPEEKAVWVGTLTATIESLLSTQSQDNTSASTPSNDSAPVWVPDYHAQYCAVCNTQFTMLKRRHHCRKCGLVVCGNCSENKRKLQQNTKAVRVCDTCAAAPKSESEPNFIVGSSPISPHNSPPTSPRIQRTTTAPVITTSNHRKTTSNLNAWVPFEKPTTERRKTKLISDSASNNSNHKSISSNINNNNSASSSNITTTAAFSAPAPPPRALTDRVSRERSATVCISSVTEARPAPSAPIPAMSPYSIPKVVAAPDFSAVVLASTSSKLAKPLYGLPLPYAPVSLLPNDTLTLVFQWLDTKTLSTARLVCKRWKRVSTKQWDDAHRLSITATSNMTSLIAPQQLQQVAKQPSPWRALALTSKKYADFEFDKTAMVILLFILLYFCM